MPGFILPALMLALSAAISGEPTGADPHAHHRAMAESSAERQSAHYEMPDLTMVDHTGANVDIPELFDAGGPVMVNFIYTTCTAVCPMMTSIFQQVQSRLGDDAGRLLMVSVSIDPEQDSPQALAAYAASFGAGPQWRFLIGSLEDSITLQKAFHAYRGDKMNHAPLTLMRADSGSDWLLFEGFASASELERESR